MSSREAGARTSMLLPSGALTGYTYDGAGALSSIVTTLPSGVISAQYTRDAAGRVIADGENRYTYDAMNRRVSSTEGTATVFFHYDGASSRVIAETDGSGATIATYTYDDAGALHSMCRDGQTYYHHLNARGDVIALSDASGDVVNTYRYDPWGKLLDESESVENPYRYASYRYDSSTGLYYCWNRYYAPELARFLTRDIYPGELTDPVTMNPYLYCGGDPVNAVDPSGEDWIAAGLAVLGVATTIAALAVTSPVWAAGLAVASVGLAFASVAYTLSGDETESDPMISSGKKNMSVALSLASAVPYVGLPFALGSAAWEITLAVAEDEQPCSRGGTK